MEFELGEMLRENPGKNSDLEFGCTARQGMGRHGRTRPWSQIEVFVRHTNQTVCKSSRACLDCCHPAIRRTGSWPRRH